ncbi:MULTISPECIES: enoyl-CoA hydratase/isomerase family protein [Streptomyces]|uniref:enoyl-CoA hydratase n=1 Tax=Streptomyces cadmiisoli TaxID=2184053 RepID=A0A2Z4J8U0_9ACTN|nr:MULTISPECIES: enoyl-CoA hydratase-related protein [Streptomyces]AWW41347.1 enoyl-CoA hydratase/isomerase family protein [Streptomyces cadmiisoli]KOV52824.1 enoyl-CoA hydratase [Streptomyces sp. AS58]
MAIETERAGRTLVVRLNRPEALNALDVEAMRALNQVLRDFRDDPTLAVGIITGTGDRAFCTGADLKKTLPPQTSFAQAYFAPYEQSVDDGLYVRAITLSELNIGKPLIAAVNGHALGGGAEIALDCDLRIASENATFGLPEARWASVPAVGGVSKLLRAVPRAVAMKMILTGDRIGAEEAHRVGLVSDLVPAEDLLPAALKLADRITANGPLAIKSLKALADRTQDMPLTQSVAVEQLLWGVLRDTDDRVEGRTAFAERRPPEYHGR